MRRRRCCWRCWASGKRRPSQPGPVRAGPKSVPRPYGRAGHRGNNSSYEQTQEGSARLSGGLDTSIIIPWLKENYGCKVVAVCGDIARAATN